MKDGDRNNSVSGVLPEYGSIVLRGGVMLLVNEYKQRNLQIVR